jgi:hypothetical protein
LLYGLYNPMMTSIENMLAFLGCLVNHFGFTHLT